MRKLPILLLFLLLFVSCKYFRGDECNNTKPFVGIYENIYDKQAKNLLIIKKGGTFEQIYTKGDVVQKNSGTWRLSSNLCEVYLNNLKMMHDFSGIVKKYHTELGIHRLDNIVFVEGLSKEFDFYRIDD